MRGTLSFPVVLIITILHFTYGSSDGAPNPDDVNFKKFDNEPYEYYTQTAPWAEATKICSKKNAELFYPKNETEATKVLNLIASNLTDKTDQSIWVGISKKSGSEDFKTIDDRSLDKVYHKFDKEKEPNDCVMLRDTGKFSTSDCTDSRLFVCKINSTQITTQKTDSQADHESKPATKGAGAGATPQLALTAAIMIIAKELWQRVV